MKVGWLVCGTTPRIGVRAGLAAAPRDAVTARNSPASSRIVAGHVARLLISRTECPKRTAPEWRSVGFEPACVESELAQRRLERRDRTTECPRVPLQSRQLLGDIGRLACDVPGIELARRSRREI